MQYPSPFGWLLMVAILNFPPKRQAIVYRTSNSQCRHYDSWKRFSEKLFCVVIHDQEDGEDFGKLISVEILNDFLEMFPPEKYIAGGSHNLTAFRDFHFRIATIVRRSAQPILETLNATPGISLTIMVEADSVTHATSSVDELGVTANLQALLGISKEVLSKFDDSMESITLKRRQRDHRGLSSVEYATRRSLFRVQGDTSCQCSSQS